MNSDSFPMFVSLGDRRSQEKQFNWPRTGHMLSTPLVRARWMNLIFGPPKAESGVGDGWSREVVVLITHKEIWVLLLTQRARYPRWPR